MIIVQAEIDDYDRTSDQYHLKKGALSPLFGKNLQKQNLYSQLRQGKTV